MQPETQFDRDKCAQRKRIAARRDGVNAAAMKFLRSAAGEGKVLATAGWLPKDEDDALARINELRPDQESPELSADDVYIHYVEAANDNFIGDRYMFMGEQTLRNIARDAERGFAFMNSHRTGGFSGEPTELPFGRTFAGRFEMFDGEGGPRKRTVIGFYMKRGIHPNGSSGPSTDDMHAMIESGQLFDVSVGLWGGERICDICGNDLFARDTETGDYLCPHSPGSHAGMSPQQVEAQKGRGVTKGKASYTLENANCSETSAVYDGAVPGAGFQKAMKVFGSLSASDRASIHESFSTLFGAQENEMAKETKPGDPGATEERTMKAFLVALKNFFTGADFSAQAEGEPANVSGVIAGGISDAVKERDALALENEQLKKDLAQKEEDEAKERAARVTAEVSAFMKEHGSKFGANGYAQFETLFREAKEEKIELASLPARLEQLVAAMPPIGEQKRVEAGGPSVDRAASQAAAKVAGDAEVNPNAAHFEALSRLEKAGVKQGTKEWPSKYAETLSAVEKEMGVTRGA